MSVPFSPAGPDPRQIVRERRIEGAYTPEAWLACLGPLAERDRRGDTVRRSVGWGIAAACAAAFVALACAHVAVTGAVFAALAAAGGVAFFLLKRQDLPNAPLQFLLPLLVVLREELPPETPVTLRLDLSGAQQAHKRLGERRWDTGWPKVKEQQFADPWLSGEARLADDSRLHWDLVDHLRRRDVRRRNARGKIKRKTKYRVKRHLTVRLGLPHESYATASAPAATQPGDRLAVRPGERRDVVRVRRVIEARSPDAPLAIEHFLDLVGQAYQRAQPAREVGR